LKNKKKIILVGFGGHASSCVDIIEDSNKFKIEGFIGTKSEIGKSKFGYKVIGTDKDLKGIFKKIKLASICLGQIKNYKKKKLYFSKLKKIGYSLPIIKSQSAYVSKNSKIKNGTLIFHGAIINAGVKIGENCIINSKSLIEHDVNIGDNCHISTGAIINGNCNIADNTFVGSGTIIKNGISISKNSFIKMKSRIIHDQ
jgi:sugar O-acyltransferase (sialic acid O-acetyltransferase NeuD family)